jgi:hypothetical protein
MDTLNTRPTWLAALQPLLAVWQYGDRSIVRGELYRMALSADAAAHSAHALQRIIEILDDDAASKDPHRKALRAIAQSALATFQQVPACAPMAMTLEHHGRLQ